MDRVTFKRTMPHLLAAAIVLGLVCCSGAADGDAAEAKTIFTSEAGKIAQKQVDGLAGKHAVVKEICDALVQEEGKSGEFVKSLTGEKAREGWEKLTDMSVEDWKQRTKELGEGLKDFESDEEPDWLSTLVGGLIHGIGMKVTAGLGVCAEIDDYMAYVSTSSDYVTDLSAGKGSELAGPGETKAKSIYRMKPKKNNKNKNR